MVTILKNGAYFENEIIYLAFSHLIIIQRRQEQIQNEIIKKHYLTALKPTMKHTQSASPSISFQNTSI